VLHRDYRLAGVEPNRPSRIVVQAEALAWLRAHPAKEGTSVVTSLPDASEIGELDFDGWRAWFVDAAREVIRWVPERGVSIFFQSDVRRGGAWVDKGYLVARAAEDEAAPFLWHKIVCRKPPGTSSLGRPTYSHMIAVSRSAPPSAARSGPDVLPDAGFMPWSRAMGVEACQVACRFLRTETATHTIVDPFCGRGTVLAVAHEMGFDTVGIDVSAKRCRAARRAVHKR
jgi:hypothetical protein